MVGSFLYVDNKHTDMAKLLLGVEYGLIVRNSTTRTPYVTSTSYGEKIGELRVDSDANAGLLFRVIPYNEPEMNRGQRYRPHLNQNRCSLQVKYNNRWYYLEFDQGTQNRVLLRSTPNGDNYIFKGRPGPNGEVTVGGYNFAIGLWDSNRDRHVYINRGTSAGSARYRRLTGTVDLANAHTGWSFNTILTPWPCVTSRAECPPGTYAYPYEWGGYTWDASQFRVGEHIFRSECTGTKLRDNPTEYLRMCNEVLREQWKHGDREKAEEWMEDICDDDETRQYCLDQCSIHDNPFSLGWDGCEGIIPTPPPDPTPVPTPEPGPTPDPGEDPGEVPGGDPGEDPGEDPLPPPSNPDGLSSTTIALIVGGVILLLLLIGAGVYMSKRKK